MSCDLIVIGASARAACFSAARAGFAPYWIDQFGDADLRAAFPGTVVAAADYPAGIIAALERAPVAPVIYTGALENHPKILGQIAAHRTLLGNSAATCARVRDPKQLREKFVAHDIDYPHILDAGVTTPRQGRWLHKPLRSGGGLGIELARAGIPAKPGHYLQEWIDGKSYAAAFIGAEDDARLLGVTRQLVGEQAFHAPAFSYCGSIGPVAPAPVVMTRWLRIGRLLTQDFGLRGLFGVDAVVNGERVTVIEVNPRYTASVEVLEVALDVQALALHIAVWEGAYLWGRVYPGHPLHPGRLKPASHEGQLPVGPVPAGQVAGKAILFAPADLVFSGIPVARCDPGGTFADLPAPGTPIGFGAPVFTVLCRAETQQACSEKLHRLAAGVHGSLGTGG